MIQANSSTNWKPAWSRSKMMNSTTAITSAASDVISAIQRACCCSVPGVFCQKACVGVCLPGSSAISNAPAKGRKISSDSTGNEGSIVAP